MSEPFIGEIRMFAGNFAPRGWAFCDGQLLSISANSALFSIMGTTYGGDAITTFGLPDLRGRVPIHPGSGPGLSSYNLGQSGGNESVSHTHSSGSDTHAHEVVGSDSGNEILQTTIASRSSASGGNATSTSAIQPYQCVNFIIALQGLFPSRS